MPGHPERARTISNGLATEPTAIGQRRRPNDSGPATTHARTRRERIAILRGVERSQIQARAVCVREEFRASRLQVRNTGYGTLILAMPVARSIARSRGAGRTRRSMRNCWPAAKACASPQCHPSRKSSSPVRRPTAINCIAGRGRDIAAIHGKPPPQRIAGGHLDLRPAARRSRCRARSAGSLHTTAVLAASPRNFSRQWAWPRAQGHGSAVRIDHVRRTVVMVVPASGIPAAHRDHSESRPRGAFADVQRRSRRWTTSPAPRWPVSPRTARRSNSCPSTA